MQVTVVTLLHNGRQCNVVLCWAIAYINFSPEGKIVLRNLVPCIPCIHIYIYISPHRPRNRSACEQHKGLSANTLVPRPREAVLPWKRAVGTLLREVLAESKLSCQLLWSTTAHTYRGESAAYVSGQPLTPLLVLSLVGLHLPLTACRASSPLQSQWNSLVTWIWLLSCFECSKFRVCPCRGAEHWLYLHSHNTVCQGSGLQHFYTFTHG